MKIFLLPNHHCQYKIKIFFLASLFFKSFKCEFITFLAEFITFWHHCADLNRKLKLSGTDSMLSPGRRISSESPYS